MLEESINQALLQSLLYKHAQSLLNKDVHFTFFAFIQI